jgi:hypothetical protein
LYICAPYESCEFSQAHHQSGEARTKSGRRTAAGT